MKDLKARWKLVTGLVVLLPFLLTMLGCQGLDAGQPSSHGSSLVAQFPTLQFGSVVVGGNRALGDTISNPTSSSITITDVSVTKGDFKVIGPAFPLTLGPGRSIYLSLAFGPQAAGSLNGTVVMSTMTGTTAGSSTFSVSGKAVPPGQAGLNPNSLSFGNVRVGAKQTKSGTITNSGGSLLTVSAMSANGTTFALLGPSVPFSLIPGQSVNYSVTFSPKNPGPVAGSLTITSSASLSVYGRDRDFRPHGSTGSTTTTVTMDGNGMMAGELSATPSSLNFGTVTVNNSRSLPTILQNTGGTTITISQATVTGAGFGVTGLALPLTLAAGQTTTFNATYNPSTAGSSSGNIAISSDADNSLLNISLSGNAVTQGALTVSPSSIAFGNVQVGSNQKQTATLTNTGGSSISVTQAAATGAGFSISGLSLPLTLNAGQTSNFTVTFAPTSGGSVTGNVAFTSTASNPSLSMPLTGSGLTAGALTASPSSLSFGSVQVGNTQTLSETLTNSGGTSVIISAASATGAGFSITGLSLPLTLSAGQSTSFSVSFAPTTTGAASGNVSVSSNATNSTLNIPLSGTGLTSGALTANPTSLSFGSVQTGNTQTLSETLTNSGGSSVIISAATATGAAFKISGLSLPVTLNAGQSTSFSVSFAPTTSGALSGNISVTSNATNPTLNIPLSGTGVAPGALTANPTSLSFGSVQTGNTQTLSETLTNSGGTSVTISQAMATGSGFSITGLSLPLTLNAGQSTSFSVSFAPTTTGAVTGSVSVSSDATNGTLNIPLSGTGVAPGALTANPTSLSFGNVTVGSNATLSETLSNSGGTSVTVTAASASAGFSVTGLSLPFTLTAGQTKTFSVIFTPAATGDVSGNLSITSNATNPSLSIPLTGTGLAAGTLSANPTSLSFGSVQTGSNQTLSETVTNTGGSNVIITAATATGAGFSVSGLSLPLTLTAGQSKSFSVVFAPTASGSVTGNLAIISNASNTTLNVALSGSGVAPGTLSANPTTNAFGNVQVGQNKLQSETLTNTGGSTLTVSQATVSGSSAFTISGLSLPLTLTAGQSFTFGVTYAPTTTGSSTGSIAVTSDGSNPNLTISLTGTGFVPGQLAVNPTSLSFGTVTVGANKALTATLNATGSTVTVSSATVSTSEFTVSGLTLPKTISAGGSATFTVTYTPQATGASSATITFNSDAANTPTLLSLSGTGGAPPQHSVSLSWTASTSTVAGYNVYRGSKGGGPYAQINSGLNSSTAYTDNTVSAGQTYFFVTTAVDSTGAESGFSNEVTAVVPTP